MSDESKNISLDKMSKQFKELSELKAYSDAQYTIIIDLNKQINKLKEEKHSLEEMLKNSQIAPIVSGAVVQFPTYSISDEEKICIEQIARLKSASPSSEFTLDQARRLEIYTKILLSLRGKEKDIDGSSKKLSTDELLKLVDSSNGNS